MTTGLERVVIVGASAAGLAAADGLREAGFDGVITILGAERHHPYDRPSLSKGLLLDKGEPEMLELRSAERISENRLDLRLGHEAVGLDVDRRFVVTNYGEALPWDAVMLACGSRPRQLPGIDGPVLPVLRTPDDLRTLRQAAARHGAVSIVGAGLIGLEIASSLVSHGVNVTVFSDTPHAMERVVGPQVGAAISALHVSHGIELRASSVVTSVTGDDGHYALHLADGTTHETPHVVVGIGVAANVDWLIGSGVELDDGVLTDAAGQTNIPGVWAAGDLARYEHPMFDEPLRFEHWTHAVEAGRNVGLNIARGTTEPFRGVPYFWTDQHGRRFQCYGRPRPGDDVLVAEGSLTENEFLVLYGSHGAFHAAFACGRARALRGYRKLLAAGATWCDAVEMAQGANPHLAAPLP